jgi:hypothetical protein
MMGYLFSANLAGHPIRNPKSQNPKLNEPTFFLILRTINKRKTRRNGESAGSGTCHEKLFSDND